MVQFEITEEVIDGKVLINFPDEYNNKKVRIMIIAEDEFGDEKDWANLPTDKKVELLKRFTGTAKSSLNENVKKFAEMPVEERLKVLELYRGTAKFPEVVTDKYSVYEQ